MVLTIDICTQFAYFVNTRATMNETKWHVSIFCMFLNMDNPCYIIMWTCFSFFTLTDLEGTSLSIKGQVSEPAISLRNSVLHLDSQPIPYHLLGTLHYLWPGGSPGKSGVLGNFFISRWEACMCGLGAYRPKIAKSKGKICMARCSTLVGTLLVNPTLCGSEIGQNGTLAVLAYT